MPAVYQSTYSAGHGNGASSSLTVSVTVPAIPTGYTILAVVNYINSNGAGGVYTCADNGASGGGTYISAGAPIIGNTTSGYDMAAFICKSSVGNPTVITITASGVTVSAFGGITATIYSNINPTTIIDGYGSLVQATPGTGANAVTSSTFTVANGDDLIFSAVFGGVANPGTGFTMALADNTGSNTSNQSTEHALSGGPVTGQTTWTIPAGPPWSMVIGFALQTLPLALVGDDMGLRILKTVDQWY